MALDIQLPSPNVSDEMGGELVAVSKSHRDEPTDAISTTPKCA